jgi:hypothetical protein
MDFSKKLRPDILSGKITVSFRLWRRPQVKAGGRYQLEGGHIVVDSVTQVPFSSITLADLKRAGESDLESLRQRAATTGPISDDTLLYRIEFHPSD